MKTKRMDGVSVGYKRTDNGSVEEEVDEGRCAKLDTSKGVDVADEAVDTAVDREKRDSGTDEVETKTSRMKSIKATVVGYLSSIPSTKWKSVRNVDAKMSIPDDNDEDESVEF